MNRRLFAVWASLIILFSVVVIIDVVTDIIPEGRGATLYVGGVGSGNYSHIQWAVDNASDGDTVFVYNGTYYENIGIIKTIDLIGEDRNNTIIDGKGIGDVIYVTSNWVNITGFTVNHSGSDWGNDAGIELYNSGNCSINACIISNNLYGLLLDSSHNNAIKNTMIISNDLGVRFQFSHGNNITNNEVLDNDGGIGLYTFSSFNYITNNTVSHNTVFGIYIYPSSENIIEFNNLTNNQWGIAVSGDGNFGHNISFNNVCGNDVGIIITNPSMPVTAGSSGHMLCSNYVHNNTMGIVLGTSDSGNIENVVIIKSEICENDIGINMEVFGGQIEGVEISQCHIEDNRIGIHMYQIYKQNTISHNNISKNEEYAIHLNNSWNSYIYLNNFFNNNYNGAQAYDNTGLNFWNTTYPTGGNHWDDYYGWDDYSGPDQDQPGRDGIGDTPYTQIDGGAGSKDYYPHINPIGNVTFLYEGWNLISIPLVQSDTDLTKVLSGIKGTYDAVQWYNISVTSDHWKHHHPSKPSQLNDLERIDNEMGFWIHIPEPGGVLFEYSGENPIQNQHITLQPGWNMVGYPSLSNRNRTAALNNIVFDQDVDAIWTFNAATQAWQEIGPNDSFELGRGYWIHSKVTKTWDVPL